MAENEAQDIITISIKIDKNDLNCLICLEYTQSNFYQCPNKLHIICKSCYDANNTFCLICNDKKPMVCNKYLEVVLNQEIQPKREIIYNNNIFKCPLCKISRSKNILFTHFNYTCVYKPYYFDFTTYFVVYFKLKDLWHVSCFSFDNQMNKKKITIDYEIYLGHGNYKKLSCKLPINTNFNDFNLEVAEKLPNNDLIFYTPVFQLVDC